MASKENNFVKSEGGAMLTSNKSAQPSFDNLKLRRDELPITKHDLLEEENEKPSEVEEQEKKVQKIANEAKDKVETEAKKKTIKVTIKSSLLPALSAIGSFILMFGVALIGVIAVAVIYNYFNGKIDDIKEFFEDTTQEVSDELKGKSKFIGSLPDYGYIEEASKSALVDDLTSFKKEEIAKLSRIDAGILAVIAYMDKYGSSYNYNNALNDICVLAYAGLKEKDTNNSYYQNLLTNTSKEKLEFGDYEDAISLKNCENFNKRETLNKELARELVNYEFDTNVYQEFLKNYYLQKNYTKEITKFMNDNKVTEESAINSLTTNIMSYYYSSISDFEESLMSKLENGAGDEDIFSSFGSIYGNATCAILEDYSYNHEYVIATGISAHEVYSLTDGVVKSVTNGVNLYQNYDLKTKKCLCNNLLCDNYNGSSVVIEFLIDDIYYEATYASLNDIYVKQGDIITKGTLIGSDGETGCTNYKHLNFSIKSKDGISYNPSDIIKKCSTTSATMMTCNLQNIIVNIVNNQNEVVKTLNFYEYVKETLYRDFKVALENEEVLKAGTIIIASKTLHDADYKVGSSEIIIKKSDYEDDDLNDYPLLDKALNQTLGSLLVYNNLPANTRYSNTCQRGTSSTNANAVYNEFCINGALKENKSYEELLEAYYPNYKLMSNYCLNYASNLNYYSLDNNRPYFKESSYTLSELNELNNILQTKVEAVGLKTRAATVEAARFLTLGLKVKIPYTNGGKYFALGLTRELANIGFDSSGFISWALLNGGAAIDESMTAFELINNKVTGSLKIDNELYKYYDKINLGDFVYSNNKIGLIIGKNDGVLYVATADSKTGLIVKEIKTYSESDFEYVYFAQDYYQGNGNLASMW